jgi:hypothetical protein
MTFGLGMHPDINNPQSTHKVAGQSDALFNGAQRVELGSAEELPAEFSDLEQLHEGQIRLGLLRFVWVKLPADDVPDPEGPLGEGVWRMAEGDDLVFYLAVMPNAEQAAWRALRRVVERQLAASA